MRPALDLIELNLESLIEITFHLRDQAGPMYATMDPDELRARSRRALLIIGHDLAVAEGQPLQMPALYGTLAALQAQQGASIADIQSGLLLVIGVARQFLYEQTTDLAERLMISEGLGRITQEAMRAATDSFTRVIQTLMQERITLIQQLSAPVLPLYTGILLIPLIGVLDDRRATFVSEQALEAIVLYQADRVLVDISGVPLLDTRVAHHLLQLGRAVQLLGAELILVGLRPETAQTIVQLGVELRGISVHATVQQGL